MKKRVAWSLCLLLVGLSFTAAAAAEITTAGDALLVKTAKYTVRFSARNGSIDAVQQAGKTGSILHSGEDGLWSVHFRDDSTVNAAAFSAADPAKRFTAAPEGTNKLRLTYRSAVINVDVVVTAADDGVEFTGMVTPHSGTVLDFAIPARLRFAPEQVHRFIFPENGNSSVGTAFNADFFKLQPQDRPAAWTRQSSGPAGYTKLYGGPLDQRPDSDPPVALRVTDAGKRYFSADLAHRIAAATANVNRPPAKGQADLVLVDSNNGPYFSASSLGGSGHLWRLGGRVGEAEQNDARSMVTAVIGKLTAADGARTKIGLLSLPNGPANGGWADVTVADWRQSLEDLTSVAAGRAKLVELDSSKAMMDALQSKDFAVILNPYGEWLLVREENGIAGTVDAIGAFVRGGGNWFEVGGYSFYYALQPVRYFQHAVTYPDAFADFLQLDAEAGSVSIFRVQPRSWQPWQGATDKQDIFVPGRLGCGGDAAGGYCERSFATYVTPNQTWSAPPVRLAVGMTAPQALTAYCRVNDIRRRLEDKMSPAVLHKFKQAVLVYYAGNCAEKLKYLDRLPVPTLIHFSDYLHGGFDKQYPDHLPPRPDFGTPEEFRAFFDKAHALGDLVMPYTNPTWWCDHPKGPTFEHAGDAPLLRTLDGKLSYEKYSANDGWTVCHWHPAVRAANDKTVSQFTKQYPVDVLFQDQCGARGWRYDMNPASPTPYAYTEGLLSMVDQDSREVPLSTESGWDRVVNAESQLCGLTWAIVPTEGGPAWRTLMKQQIPPQLWTVFPIAEYIAHDKAAMLYHDLGQFVTNREVLSWALGLGFNMSYRTGAAGLAQDAPREWLDWLDRVQKSVCARYVGEPLQAFTHDRGPNPTLADDGIIRAQYGPVAILANLGPQERTVDGRDLAPHGFWASAPGMVAGNLSAVAGRTAGDDGLSFAAEGDAHRADAWIYASASEDVGVELPAALGAAVKVTFDGHAPQRIPAQGKALPVRTPERAGTVRIAPPVELAGKAPRDWPGARPAIGIIDFGPTVRPTWTEVQPADWMAAFEGSSLAKSAGVQIKWLSSLDAITAALKSSPTVWLAIVNPYGEQFPSLPAEQGGWLATLTLIRNYVSHGGNWWETGGYSFVSALVPDTAGKWTFQHVGPSGLSFLGLPIGGGAVDQPVEPLHVTSTGRAWLGAKLSARVGQLSSTVNRGLSTGADDPGHLTLVAGKRQDFIGGYQLNGWGWLWRVGGFHPNAQVELPVAVHAMEYVYTHPPLGPLPGGVKYLWHAVVTPE